MVATPSLGTDLFIILIILHCFSGALHLVLLPVLLRACIITRANNRMRFNRNSYYKQTLICCCFCVSVLNFVCCLWSYYAYKGDWRQEQLVTVVDFSLRTLSWSALSFYLHLHFSSLSAESKFLLLLRVWWVLHVTISCFCLIVSVVFYRQQNNCFSHVLSLVSDALSVLAGLFICYLGFLKMRADKKDNLLEQPLLGDNSHSIVNSSYLTAGFISSLTFSWMGSLLALGNSKTLDLDDVPQLHGKDSTAEAFAVFSSKLELDGSVVARISAFDLVKALFISAWKDILWTGLLCLLYTLASFVGPYLIDVFIQCLSGHEEFKNQGYLLAFAFLTAKLTERLSQRNWLFKLEQIGMRTRAVLVAMIYDKGLVLSCQARQEHTTGEIINYMTIDAERIADFSQCLHDPWQVIIQVSLALFILHKNLGIASLATLLATTIVMLMNYPLGKLDESFQDKLMTSKDNRMKATTEILRNMRILKLQAWEMKFLSKIVELRKTEAGWLKKYVYTTSIVSFFFWCAPSVVSLATFGTCLLIGIPLELGKILSALATFKMLQEPIIHLPHVISMIIQCKVSLYRIASYLCLEELPINVVEEVPRDSSDTVIEIVDGTFSWDFLAPNPTLKHIDLRVFRGMKIAVCGTVGCGKSSLLSCILGEIPKISGSVKLCGTKAYVAQLPWIQNGTVEENILFGKEIEREKYESILHACSLNKDLEILSFGDQTIIGERGINLSGGQKQRIQIARALYQDADINLFDDPFSAVDAHTGSHLLKNVLYGLLSSKTVVYVTHQVEFLPAADLILVMKDGRITQAGKYNDILDSGSDFMELVGAHKTALSALDCKEEGIDSINKITNNEILIEENDKNLQNGNTDMIGEIRGQLVTEEERERGKVEFPVYWKYLITAYGGALVPFIMLLHALFQILQIGSDYWMTGATPMSKEAEKPAVSRSKLISVYVVLAFGSSFCLLVRSLLLETAGLKTATVLFNKMHLCIFRAPMSFFDRTPSGRILNRASTDQSVIDLEIAYQIWVVAFTAVNLLGTIAVMSQVAWQIFLIFLPLISASIWYQKYYIPSARELSRLVGLSKAPVIQHFAETISGSTTIRSFDQQARFRELNIKLMDAYSRPKFYGAALTQWLGFRLDMFSSITFAFCLLFLISFPEGTDLVIAGLAVTYGLSLNVLQAKVIWNICSLESKMISVERMHQFMSIPSEPALFIDDNQPKLSWPSHGEIHIANLQIRYASHLPLVLRGLTCTLPGGKKTGIVGRTGSGKSTLIQALFRIVEPTAGHIAIDGINISSVGLHDLRSRLSIIPQDPTMFEGTIRSNLDPLESYTDKEIWEALDKCQLGDEVRKKEKKLDSIVTEDGDNWSMGQKQLVCLGRVLLKKSKILVLDEATASIDTATDHLIQQTIRQHFFDCTLIIIAHRITSILDSDMVLFLTQGLIDEYDSPRRLLANKSSSFSKLVTEYSKRSDKEG